MKQNTVEEKPVPLGCVPGTYDYDTASQQYDTKNDKIINQESFSQIE